MIDYKQDKNAFEDTKIVTKVVNYFLFLQDKVVDLLECGKKNHQGIYLATFHNVLNRSTQLFIKQHSCLFHVNQLAHP